MENLWFEFRSAARRLARQKLFSLLFATTLALGLAMSIAVLSRVDAALFQPPAGLREPAGLQRVYVMHRAKPNAPFARGPLVSYPDYVDLRNVLASAGEIAAYYHAVVQGRATGDLEPLVVALVSGNYFRVLGAQTYLGRPLAQTDDAGPAAVPVAVVSHSFWRERLHGDPRAVGRSLILNGQSFSVVGVLTPKFEGISDRVPSVWTTLAMSPLLATGSDWFTEREGSYLQLVARLRPGVQAGALRAATATGVARLEVAFPLPFWSRQPATGAITQPEATPSDRGRAAMSAAFAFVSVTALVLICTNLAHLLFASYETRKQEIAVRAALGAASLRIFAQLAAETALLVLLGSAGGILLGAWATALIQLPGVERGSTLGGARGLLLATSLVLLSGLIIGAPAAWRARRGRLGDDLRGSPHGTQRGRSLFSDAIVAIQVAGSTALLVCAMLFAESLSNVRTADLGFRPRGLAVISASIVPRGATQQDAPVESHLAWAFFGEAVERVRQIPGVASASVAAAVPFRTQTAAPVDVPGRTNEATAPAVVLSNFVGTDYLRTLGLAVVAGRGLEAADYTTTPNTAVVNEAMARSFWPGESPLGKCFNLGVDIGRRCVQIVGVVRDVRSLSVREAGLPAYYVPLVPESATASMAIFVRLLPQAPVGTLADARRVLTSLRKDLAELQVETMEQLLEPQLRSWRDGAKLFGVGAITTLFVAAFGLYGLLVYDVSRRVKEIGIRLALGAAPGEIVRRIVLRGVGVAVCGVGVGLAGGAAAGIKLHPLLYGVSQDRIAVYALACAAAFIFAAVLASAVPARRAAMIDPLISLRRE